MHTERRLRRPRLRWFVALTLLLAAPVAWGGSADYSGSVSRIEFSGSGLIALKSDPTLAAPVAAIAPQWDRGQPPLALAYVSGSTPAAAVTLTIPCNTFPSSVMVRGDGPDGIEFPATTLTPSVAGGFATLSYPRHSALRPFERGMVCSYEPFVVSWQVSFDGGMRWSTVAESSCTIYLTLNQPVRDDPSAGYAQFESLFRISCRAANGATSDADVIAGVWSELADRVVRTKSGDTLAYYRTKLSESEITTGGLLLTKSGMCFAWAHLLIDLLRVQGIQRPGCYVRLNSPQAVGSGPLVGMLMPTCLFLNPTGGGINPDFPYVAAFGPRGSLELIGPDVYTQPGVPAQGQPDPISIFHDHVLVLLDHVYYDPSYGRTYPSLDAFYDNLAGWVVLGSGNEMAMHFDLNGDGKIDNLDITVARISRNPRAVSLSVERSDY